MHADRFAVAFVVAVLLSFCAIAAAQPVTMSHDLSTDNPAGDFNQLVPGDNVWFDLAVSVDPDFDPSNRAGVGNNGLATLVYDVTSLEAQARGYNLNQMEDAFSGFGGEIPFVYPSVVSDAFYVGHASEGARTHGAGFYNGGWGFNRAGLPGGGIVTQSPGSIIAAGITAPLTWTADVHPSLSGLQPLARPQVGHGTYTFVDDDPVLAGHTGGFGLSVDLANGIIVDGDGSWLFQTGLIDTTNWELGTYTFDVTPTTVHLYDGALDYSTDIPGGFRLVVNSADTTGTTFSFTLVPEPAAFVLMLVGLNAMTGRRRRADCGQVDF